MISWNIAGIDGCRYGWILVTFINGKYSVEIHRTITELIHSHSDLHRILIDIPMGLATSLYPRSIDGTLRKVMGKRGTTVFNAPCKAAVYEEDFEKAKQLNIEVEGKSLSIQTLNIKKKIKEVDQYLSQNSSTIEIIESHPELCFAYLKGGILNTKKSTTEGINERLDILQKYNKELPHLYKKSLKQFKRKDVKPDDIVDAMCLCLVNQKAGKKNLSFITDYYKQSEDGIKLRVAYWKP